MSLRIQRVRKDFLIKRVYERASTSSLVAVAHVGNLNSKQREEVRQSIAAAQGNVTFTKNSLTAKGLEQASPAAAELAPLLRGMTALATGPAEVPLAKTLLSLSKSIPDFFVLGALVNQQRVLQFHEVERLSKLADRHVIDTQLVSQMLPGSSLQVPNVAAYLVGVLSQHVLLQSEGASGPAE